MVLFEYYCETCVEHFEELVQSETDVVVCPHCQTSDRVNKAISSAGIIVLTGDGWYATDWKHK